MTGRISLRHGSISIQYGLSVLAGVAACFLAASCSPDPQKIVDQCIRVHGGEKYLKSEIEFDFRDRHYIARRNGGLFSKERILRDSLTVTHDFLTNDGFIRKINEAAISIPDSMAAKYTASINAVIYFALLPYALNDPDVHKKLLGLTDMEGQPYYRVEVTFGPGAGEGHQDTFYYWIHEKNLTLDYFAYYYQEDGQWEFRFRKAYGRRDVGGILFQDYINYKPGEPGQQFENVEALFKSNGLKELSRIELRNLSVK